MTAFGTEATAQDNPFRTHRSIPPQIRLRLISAGVKLTRSQVRIISALYVTMGSTLMSGVYGWTVRGAYYT